MKVFGLAGWSGSGKTTLMAALLPHMVARGVRVSTIKHAHHAFDVDTPGKDSHRHRQAGATEVMVSSANRWALMHELRGAPEPEVEDLIARMSPVDLLLIEGFKAHRHDKLEVFRPSVGKAPLYVADGSVVAVASDAATLDGLGSRPLLDMNSPDRIADFILAHCGLTGA